MSLFVDDVIFLHNGLYAIWCVMQSRGRITGKARQGMSGRAPKVQSWGVEGGIHAPRVPVERQRRESWGAKGVWCGERGYLPTGDWSGREKFFWLEWKMVCFGAFWVQFLQTAVI